MANSIVTITPTFQPLSVTNDYFDAIGNGKGNLVSIIAKISLVVFVIFPVVALFTLLADLFLAIHNCLCGERQITINPPATIPTPPIDNSNAPDQILSIIQDPITTNSQKEFTYEDLPDLPRSPTPIPQNPAPTTDQDLEPHSPAASIQSQDSLETNPGTPTIGILDEEVEELYQSRQSRVNSLDDSPTPPSQSSNSQFLMNPDRIVGTTLRKKVSFNIYKEFCTLLNRDRFYIKDREIKIHIAKKNIQFISIFK